MPRPCVSADAGAGPRPRASRSLAVVLNRDHQAAWLRPQRRSECASPGSSAATVHDGVGQCFAKQQFGRESIEIAQAVGAPAAGIRRKSSSIASSVAGQLADSPLAAHGSSSGSLPRPAATDRLGRFSPPDCMSAAIAGRLLPQADRSGAGRRSRPGAPGLPRRPPPGEDSIRPSVYRKNLSPGETSIPCAGGPATLNMPERIAVHLAAFCALPEALTRNQRRMSGAHHREPAGPPVQLRVTGRQILLLAQHLAHHRVDAAHGVLGRKQRPGVLAQQRLDGRGEKRGAHSVPADVRHKIAEHVGVHVDHIVEISARPFQRLVKDREGSLRTVFRDAPEWPAARRAALRGAPGAGGRWRDCFRRCADARAPAPALPRHARVWKRSPRRRSSALSPCSSRRPEPRER